MQLTQDDIEYQMQQVRALHSDLKAKMRWVEAMERHFYLCAVVLYLSGIVFGVVIAKNWWGL